jgi:hypothetical protein
MSSVAPLVVGEEEEEDRCRMTFDDDDDTADEDESWRQNALDRERSITVTNLAWPNLIRQYLQYVSVEGTLQ